MTELEVYFNSIKLPSSPVKLTQAETITDVKKFVESHLSMIKANKNNPNFKAFEDRLHLLKDILSKNESVIL